jgi:hypothetical protein
LHHPPNVVHIRVFLWQLSPLVLPALAAVPTLFQAATYKAICPTGLKLLPGGAAYTVSPGRAGRAAGCVDWRSWTASMAQLALLRRWRRHIDRVAALSTRMARLMEAEGWGNVEVIVACPHLVALSKSNAWSDLAAMVDEAAAPARARRAARAACSRGSSAGAAYCKAVASSR